MTERSKKNKKGKKIKKHTHKKVYHKHNGNKKHSHRLNNSTIKKVYVHGDNNHIQSGGTGKTLKRLYTPPLTTESRSKSSQFLDPTNPTKKKKFFPVIFEVILIIILTLLMVTKISLYNSSIIY